MRKDFDEKAIFDLFTDKENYREVLKSMGLGCGYCKYFVNEDAYGYGWCEVGGMERCCSDSCPNFKRDYTKE